MWKIINKIVIKSQWSTNPRSVIYEGQQIERQKGISEVLTAIFLLQAQNWLKKIKSQDSDNSLKYLSNGSLFICPCLKIYHTDPQPIESEIKKLNCSYSVGYDKISAK